MKNQFGVDPSQFNDNSVSLGTKPRPTPIESHAVFGNGGEAVPGYAAIHNRERIRGLMSKVKVDGADRWEGDTAVFTLPGADNEELRRRFQKAQAKKKQQLFQPAEESDGDDEDADEDGVHRDHPIGTLQQ